MMIFKSTDHSLDAGLDIVKGRYIYLCVRACVRVFYLPKDQPFGICLLY